MYVEPRKTEGVRKLILFVVLFGSAYALVAIPPFFNPSLLEGATWDAVFAGYLILASPFFLSFMSFKTMWKARVLQARPVQIDDTAIVFPTTWLNRNARIPWEGIRAVGTDFDKPGTRRRMYWHLWIASQNGRVLERPYIASEAGDAALKATLSTLGNRVAVHGGVDVLRAVGRRPAGALTIKAVQAWAILSTPAVLSMVFVLFSLKVIHGYALFLAAVLTSVFALAIPSWTWASRMRDLSRPAPSVGG